MKSAKSAGKGQLRDVSFEEKTVIGFAEVLPRHMDGFRKVDQDQFAAPVFEEITPASAPAAQVADPRLLQR